MDFLQLIFRADTTQLDAANRKVQDLGKSVDDASRRVETSSKKVTKSFDDISSSAKDTEKVVGGFNKVFEALGGAGGALGNAANQMKGLFAVMAGMATSQSSLNKEAQTANSVFNAQNAILGANVVSMGKSQSALDALTKASSRYNAIQAAWQQNKLDFPGKAPNNSPLAATRRGFNEQSKAAYQEMMAATAASQATSMSLSTMGVIAAGTVTVLGAMALGLGLVGRGAREAADAQDELAQKMGVSRERLSALQLVADENGGSVEGLVRTYDKLSKSMNKMDEDNAKTTYAFESLGVSLEDIKGQRPEVVAGLLLENYNKLGQSAKATAAIVQILGPNFRENSVAIREAATSMGEYEERVKKFGGVASDTLVKQGGEQEKSISNLSAAWKELKNQIAESTSTMTTSMTNWIAATVKAIADGVKALREFRDDAALTDAVLSAKGSSKGSITGTTMTRGAELWQQAQNEVFNGSNPNATLGDVKKRYEELLAIEKNLVKEKRDGVIQDQEGLRAALRRMNVADAETERLKKMSAAAKLPEKGAAQDKGVAGWSAYNTWGADGRKEADQAMEQWRAQQKELLSWTTENEKAFAAAAQREKGYYNDLINLQLDLTAATAQYNEETKTMGFSSLVATSTGPLEAAQNEFKQKSDATRARFGSIISAANSKGSAAAEQGDFAAYIEYAKMAREATEAMDEALRAHEFNLRNAQATSEDMWDGMKRGIKGFADSIPTLNTAMADFTKGTLADFSNRLADLFITGKFGFEDFVKTAIQQLIRLQTQMLMMKGLQYFGFGGAGGGAMAMGGAFEGGVQKFATGGVVSGPTMFGTRNGPGLMGEAGPEGILPLTRVGGKLGVSANGMGGTTIGSINITVQGGTTNEKTGQAVAEALMARIADARIQNGLRSGGLIRTAFQ